VSALCKALLVNDHVIAEVVEAELVVGSVCDVGVVSLLLLLLCLVVDYKPGCKAEEAVNTTHFLGAESRKIFVDRDDMNALAGKRIKVSGKGSDKRFSFTCFHLGNAPLMKNDAAHKLNAERTFAEDTVVSLSYDGKSVGENVVCRLSVGKALFEHIGHRAQLFVGHSPVPVRKILDSVNRRDDLLYLPLAVCSENFGYKAHLSNPFVSCKDLKSVIFLIQTIIHQFRPN